MKKYFYFAFTLFVVLALCVIGDKYRREYSFERDSNNLIALNLALDKQADELAQAIGESTAYQMLYPKELLEDNTNPDDFLQQTADKFSQGAITKEQIIHYTNEALKTAQKYKSPEEDPETAERLIGIIPNQKAKALAQTIAQQRALESKMLYDLKEQEMPLDALAWANVVKDKNISLEDLDAMAQGWIGDEKQNQRLVAQIKNYVQKGNIRPLSEKEQSIQRFYSNRIASILNPVLKNKEQIAALTPEICMDLLTTYLAEEIAADPQTAQALEEAQKDWNKDEAYKAEFNKMLKAKLKENKPHRLTFFETMQLNTCNNI